MSSHHSVISPHHNNHFSDDEGQYRPPSDANTSSLVTVLATAATVVASLIQPHLRIQMTRGRGPERLYFVRCSMATLRSVLNSQYFVFVFVNYGVTNLSPGAKLAYGQGKLQAGQRDSLYHVCILVILEPTLSSSSSNTSGGMRGKLVNDAGSSLRSYIISGSYIPNSVAFRSMASQRSPSYVDTSPLRFRNISISYLYAPVPVGQK